jgi:hypothetical protein
LLSLALLARESCDEMGQINDLAYTTWSNCGNFTGLQIPGEKNLNYGR